MSNEQSYGEKAVGRKVGNQGAPFSDIERKVDEIKLDFANIIDELNDLRAEAGDAEVMRMLSLAITEAQTASMWAVKAITWKI
jgi:hypothetical protein